MRASVSDREQLQRLDPLEVASYWQAKGGQRTDSGYERAECWSFETDAGASRDVPVPTDATVGDFALRISELLRPWSGSSSVLKRRFLLTSTMRGLT